MRQQLGHLSRGAMVVCGSLRAEGRAPSAIGVVSQPRGAFQIKNTGTCHDRAEALTIDSR